MLTVKNLPKKSKARRGFKLIYFGNNLADRSMAETQFWIDATPAQKLEAMQQFLLEELNRQGLTQKDGQKLLRSTSFFRQASR